MSELNKSYRVRTEVGGIGGNSPVLPVHLDQTYDMLEILSLKLNTTDEYKFYESDYGVIVGRVLANGGFGVANAKVSIFVPVEDTATLKERILYRFTSVTDLDFDQIRYNLLPDRLDSACHQNIGTFPNKRLVLDNDNVLEVFDKYWKYTTTTNDSGDYMLFGIPTGSQQLHVDIDLSDCGMLSQRPRDLISKGYDANLFDSPNKFKKSTNLNSLAQVYSQDRGIYVHPYWGDEIERGDDMYITRCDIEIEYKFEPKCVFMGSMVTDKGSNAIGKNCTGTDTVGKMSDLSTGEGKIEMIRKTMDGRVEQFQIMGDRLIDGDGVWCYAIPMNLDYVKTDEFGNLVPTDDPSKGIPTRARVRFRFTLDESPNDATARKRCRYLVPNNPRLDDDYPDFKKTHEADYNFGTDTREESYCDLFWNNVYTVKSYIPRLQKNNKITNRKHTGIKLINHYGDNNPFPYNSLSVKLSFQFRLICVIVKVIVAVIIGINTMLSIIGALPCALGNLKLPLIGRPFKFLLKFIPGCIVLSSEFCDDGVNKNVYYPGCTGCVWDSKTKKDCQKEQAKLDPEDQAKCTKDSAQLYTCIENELAQSNDATSFNFYNDWVNGVLYAPLWYRKIVPKKKFLFGLFKRKAKDEWCTANHHYDGLRIFQPCAVARTGSVSTYTNFDGESVFPKIMENYPCKKKGKDNCHEHTYSINGTYGLVLTRETMLGQTVYYYRSVEFDPSSELVSDIDGQKGAVKLLFATDIVLLGSLNDCDINGIPQFFKYLESTTYNLPTDILFSDNDIRNEFDENGNLVDVKYTSATEMSGCDWGNKNEYGKYDGGLFYSIGCSTIEMKPKSCINLTRVCEYGVSLDESKYVNDLATLSNDDEEGAAQLLIADGYVSFDELYGNDGRSMFATMNGNRLKTRLNKTNGLKEYDFRYLYPDNFDGSLYKVMENDFNGYANDITYRNNFKLETFSKAYYAFRMGNNPYFYDVEGRLPRYENSFYFYFGLKQGKTAIEKFNSQYFAECEDAADGTFQVGIYLKPNSWCVDAINSGSGDSYVKLDFTGISTPYDVQINGVTDTSFVETFINQVNEKVYIAESIPAEETEGYDRIQQDGSDYIKALKNGEYEIIVTDSDGNISTSMFTLKPKYLTYKVRNVKFKQPNNVLSEMGSPSSIANNRSGLNTAVAVDNINRDIGGLLIIYDVFIDDTNSGNNFKIEIKPKKGNISGYTPPSYNGVFHGDGCLSSANDMYVFGMPQGDCEYEITVTQICNGVDTRNSVSGTYLVEEPTPYKLYINDIDYDVIKNFDCGWTATDNANNPTVKKNSNTANVKDYWLDFASEDENGRFIHVSDTDNLFRWDANKTLTRNYIEEKNPQNVGEGASDYAARINDLVYEARSNFITMMKNAFWLTCPEEGKTISIDVRTDDFPYYSGLIHRQEEASEEDAYVNIIKNCNNALSEEKSESNIQIPTITNYDNELYGTSEPSYRINDSNASFAKVATNCKNGKEYKNPYFVAVCNATGKTIPSNVSVAKNGDKWEFKKANNFFGFHLIDKSFRMQMMAWAYIDNIPFYNPTDDNKKGMSIQTPGLVTGMVYNGVTPFTKNTLATTVANIESVVDDTETSLPTRRIFTGPNIGNFVGFKALNENKQKNNQYMSLLNLKMPLALEDNSGCTLDDNAYGSMKIVMSEDSINKNFDKDRVRKLSVYVQNVDSNVPVTYYIYSLKDVKYPLNEFNLDNNNQWKINVDNSEWSSNKPAAFFSYKTTKDTFKSLVYKNAKSTTTSSDMNVEETVGYGDNGNFELKKKNPFGISLPIDDKEFFIVAVTENNCRAISPVYYFGENFDTALNVKQVEVCNSTSVTVNVEIPETEEEEGYESGGASGTGEGTATTYTTEYRLDINLAKNSNETQYVTDNYYLRYYPYNIKASVTLDGGTLEGNLDVLAEHDNDGKLINDVLSIILSKNQFDKIGSNEPKVTLTITDYTGLKHTFERKITRSDIQNEIERIECSDTEEETEESNE